MNNPLSFTIYTQTAALPESWNELATKNIFLSTDYLEILVQSAPENMTCHFIGIFKDETLVGIAISQFLNATQLDSFGDRDRCYKTFARDFIFKNFAAHVLFIGNNMLTGQNAFALCDTIDTAEALKTLEKAAQELKAIFKTKGIKVHLTTFKDFSEREIIDFENSSFQKYHSFTIQPNMVFTIDKNWKSETDYTAALSKKYRDQYKRVRKKASEIEKRKMHLDDIIANETVIYDLYLHVAKNAPFNTFYLARNHFSTLKAIFKEKFLFYGYFIDDKLIGFNTLIKNGNTMDTYFLGYDEGIQKEKMLYLNMLYDMIAYSINKGFKEIVFARTALEIKSAVGAKPIQMWGLINHSNSFANLLLPKIFGYLEPKTNWQERNPFKT